MSFLKSVFMAICFAISVGAVTRDIFDNSINAGQTVTWSSDTVYILKEKVFVEEGATLTIKPGTIIKGVETTGAQASALIICRGAKIYAEGTQLKPIIFTCLSDNIGNLNSSNKGLWGGVVILGKAVNNSNEKEMEGIAPGDPRSLHGGSNDNDSSGILRYVSIRHSGMAIAPNNELNGLSLGSVGSGTLLEYVECYASSDDGFEWWGGTVNGRYLVSSFCDDDGFDIDCGYRGKLQFLFNIQDSITSLGANWAGEWDGDDVKGASPYGLHTIYNATFIGGGSTANSNNGGITFKANAGAKVYNSIFTNFKRDRAVVIEDLQDGSQDARNRFESGDIVFRNNIFWNAGGASVIDSICKWTYSVTVNGVSSTKYDPAVLVVDSIKGWKNTYANPGIETIAYGQNAKLNPLPQTNSIVFTDLASYPSNEPFFKVVNYKGAFGGSNWTVYWTGLWDEGILAEPFTGGKVEKLVYDNDIKENDKITFSKDTVYVLAQKVFVENGAVLTIQPGTIIKGTEAKGVNASALIICRGAKIIADGTKAAPIIFTAYSDDITNNSDLTETNKGLWGGVVILGKAINNSTEMEMEGIAPGDPRALHGGSDDNDSSGVLKYISIRHSGMEIAPNNELNGLSLGSVGKKTILENVECFASSDDGFEWWGGVVNGKNLIAAFCDDDGFDIDCGYRGKLQFLFCIQDSITSLGANWAGEWDGDDNKGATPFGLHTLANATFIGGGSTANSNNGGIIFKANAGAHIYNSIFTNFKRDRAIVVEDLQDASQDSRKRFESGDLKFKGNIFWKAGNATIVDSILRWTFKDGSATVYPAAVPLIDSIKSWSNAFADPMLTIGYGINKESLVPQPKNGSPAYSELAILPSDPFFTTVNYKGAFGNDNWASEWSQLSKGGYFGSFSTISNVKKNNTNNSSQFTLKTSFDKKQLKIQFSIPGNGFVSLGIYSLDGKLVKILTSGQKSAGNYVVMEENLNLAKGVYFCKLSTPFSTDVNQISIFK